MRKILFRGKRTANGEWVEGNLYVDTDGFCSIMGRDKNLIEPGNVKDVIPETVGQYTGLTDRNGKRIFEGDIVKGISYSTEWRGAIIWIDEIASFGLYCGHEVAWENSSILRRTATKTNDQFTAEAIGNIYDNPELLKDKGGE